MIFAGFYKSFADGFTGIDAGTFREPLPFIAGGVTLMAARSLSWPLVPSGVLLSCAALERGPRLRGDSGATNGERIYRILLSVSVQGKTALGRWGKQRQQTGRLVGKTASVKPAFPCLVDG